MKLKAGYVVPHPPLIIPQIGKGEELKIGKTIEAYDSIAKEIAMINPDTIIVVSTHAKSYYDYINIFPGKKAFGSFRNYGADIRFEVNYDNDFINALCALMEERNFPAGKDGCKDDVLDHGTMIPLYFIQKYLKDIKIVRISISGHSLETHYLFGQMLYQAVEATDKSFVFVASGDLSHKLLKDGPYGVSNEGVDFDKRFLEILESTQLEKLKNFDEGFLKKAAECGLRSFVVMSGAFDKYNLDVETLSYEATFGVGYAVARIKPLSKKQNTRENNNEEDSFVKLARETIEFYLNTNKELELNDIPDNMKDKAGVFVSLKKFGQLRGCIGTVFPTTTSIANEIVQNAISAAFNDPRFMPLKAHELKYLEINVDVLDKPVKVNSLDELDPLIYGVIVEFNNKSGLLLPNLEGVETVKEQIDIALKKARIAPDANYIIKKFKVTRHK